MVTAFIKKAIKKSKCKLFPNWPRPPPPTFIFKNIFDNFFFSTKNTFSVLKTYFKQSFHTRCPFWNLKFSKIQNLKNVNFGVDPPPPFWKKFTFWFFFLMASLRLFCATRPIYENLFNFLRAKNITPNALKIWGNAFLATLWYPLPGAMVECIIAG